jgi:hypothetical protein
VRPGLAVGSDVPIVWGTGGEIGGSIPTAPTAA